jgi:hypothetical protein
MQVAEERRVQDTIMQMPKKKSRLPPPTTPPTPPGPHGEQQGDGRDIREPQSQSQSRAEQQREHMRLLNGSKMIKDARLKQLEDMKAKAELTGCTFKVLRR